MPWFRPLQSRAESGHVGTPGRSPLSGHAPTIDQGSGEVQLAGRLGDIDAKTGPGGITARGSGGSVRLETGSGSITATDLQA